MNDYLSISKSYDKARTRPVQETKEAKRINIEEAYSLYEAGAPLISVDEEPIYERRHIVGSINIPLKELYKVKLNISKDQAILLYCR